MTEAYDDSLADFAFSRNLVRDFIKAGQHDEAWSVVHHAMAKPLENWWLSFDFHEYLADILRKEGKHTQALAHVLAWYAVGFWKSQNLRNFDGDLCAALTKKHSSKLRAYFNRCKFRSVSFDQCRMCAESLPAPPGLREIQRVVSEWAGS